MRNNVKCKCNFEVDVVRKRFRFVMKEKRTEILFKKGKI